MNDGMKRLEDLAIKLQIILKYSYMYHKACDYVTKSFKPDNTCCTHFST